MIVVLENQGEYCSVDVCDVVAAGSLCLGMFARVIGVLSEPSVLST